MVKGVFKLEFGRLNDEDSKTRDSKEKIETRLDSEFDSDSNLYSQSGDEAMHNPDLFEGDILGMPPGDRNAVVEKHRVWPNGRIPYTIDPKLKPQEPQILEAMRHYRAKTCINFVPKEEKDIQYVRIFPGRGCYSHVGKTLNDQPLSLGPGCFKFGIIVHELGHAVGFYHEHSRSDRDDYLNIHYENIQKGKTKEKSISSKLCFEKSLNVQLFDNILMIM
ncbi:Zinc metalloproteinase nas-13 [Araneus ventricosus]|uniref:Metalloendopeptidase n=1 Tax=Araneus ventricosus TaxID=182803 RepID=A0A4Y2LHR9_ARAVE|nr:Zinc metalloproteinase nas-13 [Araneus ventricosus]